MLTSATKRYTLPFSEKTSLAEVESAAVFAVAEFERSKGGGLIARQPQERLVFLSKVGYPLWLYPKSNQTYLFDGLGKSSASATYMETPPAKVFIDGLEANSRPRENYAAFLADHANYFQQNVKEKKFTLEGLIADAQFKQEFNLYRREASEPPANLALLLPSLDEATVSTMLMELEKLQTLLKEDAQRLSECLRIINKTTSQYMTEIDYEAAAATEEAEAKIKAQEQIVNPQVAQLNKDYSRKIKETAAGFDNELESLEKLKTKTEQFIKRNQEETKQYVREAKAHAAKGHEVYEKRWKEKIKKAQKELGALKKELSNQENQTKKLTHQKTQAISQLTLELDMEVKLARQPLLELEAARDVKVRFFKQETQKLLLQEKPVIEGLNKTIRLREEVAGNFDALSIGEVGLKGPALFYVPFYVACYEAGLSRRYFVVPPSTVSTVDFSSKLRGALGMSKAKDLLVPRFKAVAALVGSVGVYVKQNSAFESQLWELSQRNNLLRVSGFQENAKRGLTYLKQAGWLSEREQQELTSRIVA